MGFTIDMTSPDNTNECIGKPPTTCRRYALSEHYLPLSHRLSDISRKPLTLEIYSTARRLLKRANANSQQSVQGGGAAASKEANKSMPQLLSVIPVLLANATYQTWPKTTMHLSALALRQPRMPLETSSTRRSMTPRPMCTRRHPRTELISV